jgi:hypothetical protein
MTDERTWEQFRDAGLLWWINRGLHLFGWAIVVEVENETTNKVTRVYPARCKFRGFGAESEARGFRKLTKHIEDELPTLLKDSEIE